MIAGPAFVGSCALTKDLVASMLGIDPSSYVPTGVTELLATHESITGLSHAFRFLVPQHNVQQLLSTERHQTMFDRLKTKSSPRSKNLMLACTMSHASDWLLAPPIHALGLNSDVFRTALKFRLSIRFFKSLSRVPQ